MFMRLVFSCWKLFVEGKLGNPDEENDYYSGISYWLWKFHGMGRLLDATDYKLNGEFAKDGLECLLLLRVAYCHPNPHQRPFMRTVLQVLSGETTPLIPHESPTIIWPALPSSSKESECSLTGSQLASFSEIKGR
ncbi:hypothetical protein NC652_017182 [Populus alba x Populus x berolinensis]|uniref:Serine-threonine/tyrosine-protein kinase catalytic domain-containing protein n=1 Tax=Populus tomentosa TaxID=118781 RepID=A0A8X7ZNS7_POPTO|nr:hypothetical protein POTOM_023724 [Populus tomentosa]KAJ6923784.1 hypothetical protein NC652_017182 [Populus alba x Populus x berolinensis]